MPGERRGAGRSESRARRCLGAALRAWAAALLALGAASALRADPPGATAVPAAHADELLLRELESRISRLPQRVLELSEPRESPAAPPPPAPPAESLPPALAPDEVRYVPLPRLEEQRTRELASEQLQAAEPEGDVALFAGAIRASGGASGALTLKAVAFGAEPLRYREQSGRFEGLIRVGVVQLGGGSGAAQTLPAPVMFQVIGPVSASPAAVEVRSTAPPYQDIAIAADSPGDAIDLRVVSNVSPEGVLLRVLVQPTLFVRSTPVRIQGFGLETAKILVLTRGGAGAGRHVQLATDLGNLEPVELELSTEGTASSELRSSSIGRATLTASSGSFADGGAAVRFVFPVRFLIAALLGGIAGGLLRRSIQPAERRRAHPWRELGLAVLWGQLVFMLYALGVNVVGFELPWVAGEVLVVVVCALGALFGSDVLRGVSSTVISRFARR